jgi:hypothetical protein
MIPSDEQAVIMEITMSTHQDSIYAHQYSITSLLLPEVLNECAGMAKGALDWLLSMYVMNVIGYCLHGKIK